MGCKMTRMKKKSRENASTREDQTLFGLSGIDIMALERKELQKLCKEFGIRANGKTAELQDKLKKLKSESNNNTMEESREDKTEDQQTPKKRISKPDEHRDKSYISKTTRLQTATKTTKVKKQEKKDISTVDKLKEGDEHETKKERENVKTGRKTRRNDVGKDVAVVTEDINTKCDEHLVDDDSFVIKRICKYDDIPKYDDDDDDDDGDGIENERTRKKSRQKDRQNENLHQGSKILRNYPAKQKKVQKRASAENSIKHQAKSLEGRLVEKSKKPEVVASKKYLTKKKQTKADKSVAKDLLVGGIGLVDKTAGGSLKGKSDPSNGNTQTLHTSDNNVETVELGDKTKKYQDVKGQANDLVSLSRDEMQHEENKGLRDETKKGPGAKKFVRKAKTNHKVTEKAQRLCASFEATKSGELEVNEEHKQSGINDEDGCREASECLVVDVTGQANNVESFVINDMKENEELGNEITKKANKLARKTKTKQKVTGKAQHLNKSFEVTKSGEVNEDRTPTDVNDGIKSFVRDDIQENEELGNEITKKAKKFARKAKTREKNTEKAHRLNKSYESTKSGEVNEDRTPTDINDDIGSFVRDDIQENEELGNEITKKANIFARKTKTRQKDMEKEHRLNKSYESTKSGAVNEKQAHSDMFVIDDVESFVRDEKQENEEFGDELTSQENTSVGDFCPDHKSADLDHSSSLDKESDSTFTVEENGHIQTKEMENSIGDLSEYNSTCLESDCSLGKERDSTFTVEESDQTKENILGKPSLDEMGRGNSVSSTKDDNRKPDAVNIVPTTNGLEISIRRPPATFCTRWCVVEGILKHDSEISWKRVKLKGGRPIVPNRFGKHIPFVLEPSLLDVPSDFRDNYVCGSCVRDNEGLYGERCGTKTTSNLKEQRSSLSKPSHKDIENTETPLNTFTRDGIRASVKRKRVEDHTILARNQEEAEVQMLHSKRQRNSLTTSDSGTPASPVVRKSRGEKIKLPKNHKKPWRPKKTSRSSSPLVEDASYAQKVEAIIKNIVPGSEEELNLIMSKNSLVKRSPTKR